MLFPLTVSAQQYHMVPSGDPLNPYRVEQIIPPDVRDVPTFTGAINTLRALEGIDPGLTVTIMQNPGPTAKPAELCSTPAGTIMQCANAGLTVQ